MFNLYRDKEVSNKITTRCKSTVEAAYVASFSKDLKPGMRPAECQGHVAFFVEV